MSNREFKSDVFSMLMEDPKNALSVYNTLNHSDYQDLSLIKIYKLENGMHLSVRNDACSHYVHGNGSDCFCRGTDRTGTCCFNHFAINSECISHQCVYLNVCIYQCVSLCIKEARAPRAL